MTTPQHDRNHQRPSQEKNEERVHPTQRGHERPAKTTDGEDVRYVDRGGRLDRPEE